jgi:hypothetical protein
VASQGLLVDRDGALMLASRAAGRLTWADLIGRRSSANNPASIRANGRRSAFSMACGVVNHVATVESAVVRRNA